MRACCPMNRSKEEPQQQHYRRRSKRRRVADHNSHVHRGRQQSGPRHPFCDVCNVYVTPSRSAWQQHVEGVRHRTKDHQLRYCGERGHAVEAGPDQRQQRHVSGVDSAGAEASGRALRGSAAPRPCGMEADIHRVMRVIREELVNHTYHCEPLGATVSNSKMAEEFREASLRRDWKRMEAELSGMGGAWLLGGIGPITPGQLAALSSLIHSRTYSEVTVKVDLQPFDHLAVATVAALCVFLDAVGSSLHLRKLTLIVAPARWVGFKPLTVQLLQSKWPSVMKRMSKALSENVLLRQFSLVIPQPLACEGDAEALGSTLASIPQRLRMAILLGTQARVGEKSPLRWMPPNVVQSIVELAVPREPCGLEFSTVPLPNAL